MKRNKLALLIIMSALMIYFLHSFWVVMPTAEIWTLMDYQNHFKYMADPQAYANEYPTMIYTLYPAFPWSLFIHLGLILPILLYLYAQNLNRTGYMSFIIYFFSIQYILILALGVMKEIIIIEAILLALTLLLKFRKSKTAMLIILTAFALIALYLEPPTRLVGLTDKGYNNFYYTSIWATLFLPVALTELKLSKDKTLKYFFGLLFIAFMFVGLFFETRVLGTLFLIELPFVAKYFKRIMGGLNERIRKLNTENKKNIQANA